MIAMAAFLLLEVAPVLVTPETCATVRQDRAVEERSLAQRARRLKEQDIAEAQAGRGSLERNTKFLRFQADLQDFQDRYGRRLSNCTKTGSDAQNR
jgi:hypothetical protein